MSDEAAALKVVEPSDEGRTRGVHSRDQPSERLWIRAASRYVEVKKNLPSRLSEWMRIEESHARLPPGQDLTGLIYEFISTQRVGLAAIAGDGRQADD